MTSYTQEIRDVLRNVPDLVDLMEGGIYCEDDFGKDGLSQTSSPSGVFVHGFLVPTLVVKERGEMPWGGVNDTDHQTMSMQTTVEIYLYDESASTYELVEQARDLVYSALHRQFAANSRLRNIFNANNLRDAELNNAIMIRADYAALRIKETGG